MAGPSGLVGLVGVAARSALVRHRPAEAPDAEVVRPDVRVDVAHLAAYSHLCGYPLTGALPATYLHVLTFPLQTALMGRDDFPFPLAGLVHVAQRLEPHRAVLPGEVLRLAVRAADVRPHRRGRQLDVVSQAWVEDEPVYTGVSTYLHRGPATAAPADELALAVDLSAAPHARWRLPADRGRRYAAVSGDYNPIHLNPLSARAFGFPRTIAHGMDGLARAVASLAGSTRASDVVEAAFRRPVLLPSTVELRSAATSGGWDLLLTGRRRDDRAPDEHLRVRIRARA